MVNYTAYKDPRRRLQRLRDAGKGHQGKFKALIVDKITPEIREHFGGDFLLLTEGAGLYSQNFSVVFTTVIPSTPKLNFWWREVARRTDGGAVTFL